MLFRNLELELLVYSMLGSCFVSMCLILAYAFNNKGKIKYDVIYITFLFMSLGLFLRMVYLLYTYDIDKL